MSVEVLENIKEQANRLSPQEKFLLADYLVRSAENTVVETDLRPKAESLEEKRRMRDKWMKANREKYGGLYVALDGSRLVGTGKNYAEAARQAHLAGVEEAVIDIVLPPDYVGELGGWE